MKVRVLAAVSVLALALWMLFRALCAPKPLTQFTAGFGDTRATAHFSWAELDPTGKLRKQPGTRAEMHSLARNLEEVRQWLDTPLQVTGTTVDSSGNVTMTVTPIATLPDGSPTYTASQLYNVIAQFQRQGRVQFGNVTIAPNKPNSILVSSGDVRWSP